MYLQKIIGDLRLILQYNNGISKKQKKKQKKNKLDNTPDQTSKFGTNYWVEINDDARVTYNTNSQVEFKISMLKSRL